MAHYAKVENGIVTDIIVAEQDFIDSGAVGDPSMWIQTSYNTRGGIHTLGGTPLRKNYAGIGYQYIVEIDAFVPPKIHASWILDEVAGAWIAPIAAPDDGKSYSWSEETQSWIEAPNVLPGGI
jgi:hypothetical protein